MAGFQHDIAGGSGNLIIPMLQSPDFSIAGETGWAILKNGDAYFYNVTAEGSITTTSVIIEGSTGSILIYSGTPSAGNLIGSWAGASGSDGDGNPYPAALSVGLASGVQIQLGLNGSNAGVVRFDLNSSSFLNPEVNSAVLGSPSYASMGIIGPAATVSGHGDYVEEAFNSANTGGTSTANLEWIYVSTSGSPTTMAAMNNDGFTFYQPVDVTISLTVNGTDVGATISAIISALSGQATTTNGLTDGTINGSSTTTGLPNGGIQGTSGGASAGTAHTHSAGGYSVTNGMHTHGPGSYAVTNGTHDHDLPVV